MTANISIGLMIIAAFLAALSQVFLKKSAMITRRKRINEFANPLVITGYTILILTMAINILAYRQVDYKVGPILNATSYIFVTFLSFLFFKERITKSKMIGCLLIMGGVLLYNLF